MWARCLVALAIAAVGCGDSEDEDSTSSATSSGTGAAGGSGASGQGGGGGENVGGIGGAGAAAGGSGGSGAWPNIDYCNACGRSAERGTVASGEIGEVSGIAASAKHAGAYYVHNDSGDDPRFFAIDATGADLGMWDVTGAMANDWEDMARGPCESESCLFFGDIGNNRQSASKPYAIYRVLEPDALGGGGSLAADALPFAYPSGYPNSETLLVHPITGVITVVTKVEAGPSAIVEMPMPLMPGEEATLLEKGKVMPPMGDIHFTGGDVHPGGLGVLLRTYSHAFFFAMTPDQSVADALLGTPCVVPAPGGGQAEAIGWLSDASGWIGVSEGNDAPVSVVHCDGP